MPFDPPCAASRRPATGPPHRLQQRRVKDHSCRDLQLYLTVLYLFGYREGVSVESCERVTVPGSDRDAGPRSAEDGPRVRGAGPRRRPMAAERVRGPDRGEFRRAPGVAGTARASPDALGGTAVAIFLVPARARGPARPRRGRDGRVAPEAAVASAGGPTPRCAYVSHTSKSGSRRRIRGREILQLKSRSSYSPSAGPADGRAARRSSRAEGDRRQDRQSGRRRRQNRPRPASTSQTHGDIAVVIAGARGLRPHPAGKARGPGVRHRREVFPTLATLITGTSRKSISGGP